MVSVLIVTWNSEPFLEACFASIDRQDCPNLEVIVVDNDSADGTRALLRLRESTWRVIYNDKNVGFAAGQNQAIRAAHGDWLLCLNPDVMLAPDFVRRLMETGSAHPGAGALCGKLLRWDPDADPPQTRILDSTGIYFTRNMRHLDRGAEELDTGQYDRAQWVFGATGAAAMIRRSFVEAVSVEGQFFDQDFFSYREDADLAWRGQLMGWRCLYVPQAVAWHVRRVTPERREQLPLEINWHSVKNRFLMRGKNASGWLCWRLFWPVAWRDAMILGFALVRDWRLLSALVYPLRNLANIRRKRTIIQVRRRVADRELLWWFNDSPRAVNAELSTAISEGASSASRLQQSEGRP
ncbi:MAG TPA: glycosyltransferase family 2 protein [Candidatus Bathyarchaeia archaeon]|nr:glycosyltransferase family 2 protein [Candidatus Bathyarchaeia archaeon]